MNAAVAPNSASPAMGRMVGKTHHFPIRVYYADTDAGGMVYHGIYLAYAERARTEMMRLGGMDHITLRQRYGMMLAVRRAVIHYQRPARLDDWLEMRTSLIKVGGASLDLRQVAWRGEEELARLEIGLAAIGDDGRPARIAQVLRGKFEDFLLEEATS